MSINLKKNFKKGHKFESFPSLLIGTGVKQLAEAEQVSAL
jgi:hypothetical protein